MNSRPFHEFVRLVTHSESVGPVDRIFMPATESASAAA